MLNISQFLQYSNTQQTSFGEREEGNIGYVSESFIFMIFQRNILHFHVYSILSKEFNL